MQTNFFSEFMSAAVAVMVALAGLAALEVFFSSRSQTPAVLQAGFQGFGQDLSAAEGMGQPGGMM